MSDATFPTTFGAYVNQKSPNVLTLDNQPYLVEVWIYNMLDKFKPFNIPTFFINELVIDEELHNWYITGSITIINDYEAFEKGALSQTYNYAKGAIKKQNNNPDLPQINAPFNFRSDGRNKIAIRIKPLPNPTNDTNASTSTNNTPNNSYPDKVWQMSYDCIVYDIEDLKVDDDKKKLKKLNFVDERYQIFSERNIEWSTSLYNNKNSSGGSDINRTMSSSLAIKSLITTAVSDNSNPNGTLIKVGSPEGPKEIANPKNFINNFSDNWDNGSSDSILQYTSPSTGNVLEDIDYVFDSLKASDGSPLFLRLDRYDNPIGKQFSLIPLSYYFQNAKQNQIERFILHDGVDPIATQPYFNRAPIDNSIDPSNPVNFFSTYGSRIASYEFVPMTVADDYGLNNTPIHNYDFSAGEFIIEFEGNAVKNLYNNVQIHTSGLYGYDRSKQLLLNINQTKQKGLSINNKFRPRTFAPKQMAGVDMMESFLLLNQAISFNTVGLTFRTPGKFIFIDRDTSTAEKNPFDDKALGQWMLTKISHIFSREKDIYLNNIIAVKVDAFNKWWDVLDPVSSGTDMTNY